MKKYSSTDSYLMDNLKEGLTFYSENEDRNLTAKAVYYKRSIKTERIIVIGGDRSNPVASTLTKVILMNKPQIK